MLAVLILTLFVSLFIGGGIWLSLGNKLMLSSDQRSNEVLNLAAYFLGTLPLSFVLVFFGIGGL